MAQNEQSDDRPDNRPAGAEKPPKGSRKKAPSREQRLADALRQNLRRRKSGATLGDKDE